MKLKPNPDVQHKDRRYEMRWKMQFEVIMDDSECDPELLSLATASDVIHSYLAPLGIESVQAFAFRLLDRNEPLDDEED